MCGGKHVCMSAHVCGGQTCLYECSHVGGGGGQTCLYECSHVCEGQTCLYECSHVFGGIHVCMSAHMCVRANIFV